jgi:hypothetical protein
VAENVLKVRPASLKFEICWDRNSCLHDMMHATHKKPRALALPVV